MIQVQSHNFGNRSLSEIATLKEGLQLVLHEGLKHCPVDFGVHEGERTFETQLDYFLTGKTTIDPRTGAKSKHQNSPSEAFDFHVASKYKGESLAWELRHLIFVAAFLMGVASRLYEEGKIDFLLRWGGNWDNDGVILDDQNFDDLPHLETYIP